MSIISHSLVKSLIGILVVMSVEYIGVLVAILADLRSGTMKARRMGVRRTSRGYRRTVEKASRYYVTLIALSVIDAMLIVSGLFLSVTTEWTVPVFPIFTTIGAIGLTLIEVKSIYESSEEKGDYGEVLSMLSKIIDRKETKEAIARLLKGEM